MRFFLIVSFSCLAVSGFAQDKVETLLTNLKSTQTQEEFLTYINKIEVLHREDSIKLNDQQFKAVIDIAKNMTFADKVLPHVYRWVGLRFASGRMDEAIMYFLESATLYEKQHKLLEQALCCLEVALIQHNAKNFEEAKEYYIKTLAIAKDSLDHRAVIICHNGIALIDRENKDYDHAITEFRNGLKVAIDNKDQAWIGIMEGNIGSVFLLKEEYDSSLFYYQKNLRDIKKTTEVENEIETYERIARIYIGRKNYRKALLYLDSSEYVIKSRRISFTAFFEPRDNINEAYALAYSALGNYQKAYEHYNLFHTIQERKQLQQKGQSMAQLQSAYSFRQKQSELDLLHRINEANLTIISQQRYAQIASLIVIVLLGGLALFAYYISRQRKNLNIKLNGANAELERLNQTKDKLFSVVSHDLRGPLLNLRAMIELLNAGHIDSNEFNQVLEKINQQLNATSNALDNLLHWAKSQLSDMKVRPELVLINKKVEKVIGELIEDAKKKEIDLINEVPSGLTAFVDKNQLEIVFRNLISNALKFTGKNGFVKIGAARLNDICVEIFVEDNGIGMESKDVERLFQPGKQFTRMGTHDEKGTGIGLIITKEMVKANGGDIRVTSEKSKGSRFIFTLPVG